MLSGKSWVSISIPVSAINIHIRMNALSASGPQPNCQAASPVSIPVSISTSGYRAEIGVSQWAQRPRSRSQLTTGMFCQGRMLSPQAGHCELGLERLIGVSVDAGCANNSEHSRRQLCSIIFGSLRMTTFKKLPTISPSKVQVIVKKKGSCRASIVGLFSLCSTPSNRRAQYKSRQVHGNHQSTDQNPQHRHYYRFNHLSILKACRWACNTGSV